MSIEASGGSPPMQRFSARDLKPYAEPISPLDLRKGSVYFVVSYADEDLLIPLLEPLVFIGRDLEPDDENHVYFQDVGSYRKGIPYSGLQGAHTSFHVYSAKYINNFFEYERALDELMRCSLRRQDGSSL